MSLGKSLNRRTFSLLAAALLCLTAAPMKAQFNLGTITGTVVDPNGGVVVGCVVKAVSLTSQSTRTTAPNSTGVYTLPSLPADTYQVSVQAPGFQVVTTRLELGVDQTVNFDFHLQLGNVSEQVQVTSQASQVEVEKDSHEISNLVTNQDIENLPANGRSFMGIAAVGPGRRKVIGFRGPGRTIRHLRPDQPRNCAGRPDHRQHGVFAGWRTQYEPPYANLEYRSFHGVHSGAERGIERHVRQVSDTRPGECDQQTRHQPVPRHAVRLPAKRRAECQEFLRLHQGSLCATTSSAEFSADRS